MYSAGQEECSYIKSISLPYHSQWNVQRSFEIAVHDMPREQAIRDVAQFRNFYTAGWLELMKE